MQSIEDFKGQLRRQARWLAESRRWIISETLEKEDKIHNALDVGCGPGFIMKELKENFEIQSLGVDLDRGMLDRARALDMDVICANGHILPFSDECFDLVHCTFTLIHSPPFRNRL